MRYGIVANPEKEECVALAAEIKNRIPDAVVEEKIAKILNLDDGVSLEEMDVDVIITVGGDGTILLALQRAKGKILGVNMGLLGYLTEIEPSQLWESLRRIEEGNYRVEKRMKIKVMLNGKRLHDCTNEAVVHTAEIAKLRSYGIYFENEILDRFRADGIIVATPTGSTSYSLSAGGPILHPRIEGIIITPLSPFKRYPRSFVLPAGKVRIEIADGKKNLLVLDGQETVEIKGDDVVEIEKSENYAEFIRFSSSEMERIGNIILG